MKLLSTVRSERGASLVEVIIVGSIIAILATISVPSFQKYRANAIRKEAIAQLSDYYRGAKVMIAEYGTSPGNFVSIGYMPDGDLHYNIRALDGADPPFGYPNDNDCVNTGVPGNCTDGANVNVGYIVNWTPLPFGCNNGGAPTTSGVGPTFRAVACSRLPGGNGVDDVISIDETKLIVVEQNGI